MPNVTLYTRQGCGLCEEAHAVLLQAHRRARFELSVVDIDADDELRRQYTIDVPVITIDGRIAFEHQVRLEEFLARLESAV
jgi:glutaredoxin